MEPTAEILNERTLLAVGSRHAIAFEQISSIKKIAAEVVPKIYSYLAELDLPAVRPSIFEYRYRQDPKGKRLPKAKFTLTIAVPVPKVVKPPAPLKFLNLERFKYIELITDRYGEEWRRIRDFADAQGFERDWVERGVNISWEGPGHRHTRVALQVGVK